MDWWICVVGAALAAGVGLLRESLRRARAAVAARRIAAGRALCLPGRVGPPGGDRRAVLHRDGGDLVVRSARTHLRIDARALVGAQTGAVRYDAAHAELRDLRLVRAADGTRYEVGVVEEWDAAYRLLLEAPCAGAAPRRVRWAALVPASGALLSGLALAAGLLFQGAYAAGTSVAATVTTVTADADEPGYLHCGVAWSDPWDGSPQHATTDCPQPAPALGDTVTVRALQTPFRGEAFDEEGTYEGVTVVLGLVLLAALGGTAGVATRRARAEGLRATPVGTTSHPTAPRGDTPTFSSVVDVLTPDRVRALTLRELVRAVSVRETGSESTDLDVVATQRARASLRRELGVTSLTSGWWSPVAILPALAVGFWAELPRSVRGAALVVTAGWAICLLVRCLVELVGLRRLRSAPTTSEWDFVTVRSVDEVHLVLLLLGDTPHWVVPFDVPLPRAGRLGVRGELGEAGALHVVVAGVTLVPPGPAHRVTAEDRRELRGLLRATLLGTDEADDIDPVDEATPLDRAH